MNKIQVEKVSRKPTGCQACANLNRCLFSILGTEERTQLCYKIQSKRILQKGEKIFNQGDDSKSIYLLQTGAVKSSITAENGEEQIIAFNMAGDILGVDSFDTGLHEYTAECLETSSVCEISSKSFLNVISENSRLNREFIKRLTRLSIIDSSAIVRLGKMTSQQKLASFIIDTWKIQTNDSSKRLDIHLSMSRGDVANYLGLAIETVSRLLSRFQDLGIIEVQRRRIFICRHDVLNAIVVDDLDISDLVKQVA